MHKNKSRVKSVRAYMRVGLGRQSFIIAYCRYSASRSLDIVVSNESMVVAVVVEHTWCCSREEPDHHRGWGGFAFVRRARLSNVQKFISCMN